MANPNTALKDKSIDELKVLVYDLNRNRNSIIQSLNIVEDEIAKREAEQQQAAFDAQQEQAKKNGTKERKLVVADEPPAQAAP